jgi:hypothetical protein
VWAAASTTDRDRKELLRTLLDDVVINVDREARHAIVELFWQGGAQRTARDRTAVHRLHPTHRGGFA